MHDLLEPGPDHPTETLDTVCGGRVQVLQSRGGYRFNLDPLLLAHFAAGARAGLRGPVMDLGAGSGIISLILARKFELTVTGLEVQPRLHALAQRNVLLNGCEGRMSVVLGDWRHVRALFPAGAFCHVLSNPPYHAQACGRVNPEREKAIARHELEGTLVDLCRAAQHLLGHGGSLSVVYPSSRLAEVFSALKAHGMEPKRLRLVHPRMGTPAKRVLLQAVRGGRAELSVEAPLYLHSPERGEVTPEVAAMVG